MNLRLWQRLFLTFAVLSSVALAAFVAWQQHAFRKGFLGYLDEIALERLQPVTERLAAAYAENGNWAFLRGDPRRFADLIEPELRPARRPPPPRPGPGWADDRPPPPPPPPADAYDDRPPPPDRHGLGRARRARMAEINLLSRLLLVDERERPVVGDPQIATDGVRLPIEVDGQVVGGLFLRSLPQLRGDTDLAFARDQLSNALIACVAILGLALLLAFALARWLLDPIRELAAGTRALAEGDYARRVGERRGDELGDLARDFNHLADTLEQHRESRRRWGADIAHELRTPLSVLRGEIQALQDGVREVTPAALNSLNAECERIGNLVEDLYQLALADAGALEYRFEDVDLGGLLREAVDAQRHSFGDLGLELELALGEASAIRGDGRRLAQLIDNLLANSRRYTDAPGRIRIELREDADAVLLLIEDSAPGVPDAAVPKLFDRLFRVESSRNRSAGGAGLGLAICQAIVQAHGGRIVATASALGGLRIEVRFPPAARTR